MASEPKDLTHLRAALDTILNFACEELPEDWELVIQMRRGEACAELYDPNGDPVEFCNDDCDMARIIANRVRHARTSDGLEPPETYDPREDAPTWTPY